MQVFSVTVERLASRRLQVLAASADRAIAMVQATLPSGARATKASPLHDESLTGSVGCGMGVEAIDHLLERDFLAVDGRPTLVRDWVLLARQLSERDRANRALAMAGMRIIMGDRVEEYFLAVGSAISVPLLAHWCDGTPFAGAALLPTLASIPGALRPRSGFTFAGVPSRVVLIPAENVWREAE